MRIKISILMFILSQVCSFSLQANFKIMPAAHVEVGEKVLFNAGNTVHDGPGKLSRARFEWDFGDGYTYKYGSPKTSTMKGGISCTHFFMKPGTFKVKLKVSLFQYDNLDRPIGPPLAVDSISKPVQVHGEAPVQGFEVWHAPYHCRAAQYILIKIPKSARKKAENRLVISLSDTSKTRSILFDKSKLKAEEKFLFDQRKIPSGKYKISFEILDPNDKRISIIRENIFKQYEGTPIVAIDENNAIFLNGQLVFPVTSYILKKGEMRGWANAGYINTNFGVGYYPKHTTGTWSDYLFVSKSMSLHVIGPVRWAGLVERHFARNINLDHFEKYLEKNKKSPSLFMWAWMDEPNLGGRNHKVPPAVLDSWSTLCRIKDPHHPVIYSLYGYGNLPYYGESGNEYDYINSAGEFGGKRNFYCDILAFDIYPLEYQTHTNLTNPERGPIDLYAEAIDNIIQRNNNLIPVLSFVEVCDIRLNKTIGPTGRQVLMEAWLNVVHGVKGICWFHYFQVKTIQFDAMRKFTSQVTRLAPIILSPDTAHSVSDDANKRGKRVDVMTRASASHFYLFAVRVTEPESEYGEKLEPDSIIVNFSIPKGLFNSAEVYDENRLLPIRDNTLTDTFKREDVHIYKIQKSGAQ